MILKNYTEFVNEIVYVGIKGLKGYEVQAIRPGYRKSDLGHAIIKLIYSNEDEISLLVEIYGKVDDKELIVKVYGSTIDVNEDKFKYAIDKLVYILNKNLLGEKFNIKSIMYDKDLESYSILGVNNKMPIDKLEQVLTSTKISNMKVKDNDDYEKMIYQTYNENNKEVWTYEGDFTATKDMINNGRFIEGKIPDIVNGSFSCNGNNLISLEGGPVKVGGHFDCSYNQLTSLEGSPKEIGGDFFCDNNKLTNIKGGPNIVGGYFDCSYNQLTNIKGGPKEVGGHFYCSYNQLTSLLGGPKEVGGDFECIHNQLTSLEGVPFKIEGSFRCNKNQLKNLIGSPEKIGGSFDCITNNLTSLEGSPIEVTGYFDCNNNNLTNLKGCPNIIGGDFYCNSNQLTSLEGISKNFNRILSILENLIDLKIEKDFIESGSFKDDYYLDLLNYCLVKNIDLEKVESWPNDFLTDNIKTSAKNINKFNL